MNDASVKTTLLALIGKVEDLEASKAAAIALLIGLSKGKISSSDVRHATARAKSLNKKPFDKLRKAINEISSQIHSPIRNPPSLSGFSCFRT